MKQINNNSLTKVGIGTLKMITTPDGWIYDTSNYDVEKTSEFITRLNDVYPEKMLSIMEVKFSVDDVSKYLDFKNSTIDTFDVVDFKHWILSRPQAGDMWYNTKLGKTQVYTTDSWITL